MWEAGSGGLAVVGLAMPSTDSVSVGGRQAVFWAWNAE